MSDTLSAPLDTSPTRGRLRVWTILIGVVATLLTAAALAPEAEAATGKRCFDRSINDTLKINKRPLKRDDHIAYGADFRFCAINGRVVEFVVYGTHGEDAGVKVDIRPLYPLQWGPTYPIQINATKGKDSSHKEFTLTASGIVARR